MSDWTPGPWRVDCQLLRVVADDGGEGFPVCDIRGWGFLTGAGGRALPAEDAARIQDANAHLISAAPDLLEALEKMLAAHEVMSTCSCDEIRYCHHADHGAEAFEARAAIAKAKGEAK